MSDQNEDSSSVPLAAQADQLIASHNERQHRTRLFGVWMLIMGLLLLPSGFSLPWEWPVHIGILIATFVVFVAATLYLRIRRVLAGSSALTIVFGAWLAVSVLLAAMIPDNSSFALGMAASVAASVPFFVVGVMFLRRSFAPAPSEI
jgi:uncharacterized membrane protein